MVFATTRRSRIGLAAAGVVAFLCILSTPAALGDPGSAGMVFVETNTAPANYVLAFSRAHDGTLTPAGRYATLGVGKPAGNPPLDIPFLASAGSVGLSDDGDLLFAVNAGDNTVSSFRVTGHGLELADIIPTFGSRPISLTSHDHLLYVLNSDTNDASISGYNVTGDGGMTPIVGSHRPTSDPDGGQPAQITFDSTGKVLAVSERLAGPGGNGLIDTYTIGKDGAAGLPVTHPSTGVDPFAIAFTHDDLMILANEHFPTTDLSSVSTYDLSKDGSVTPVDSKPNPGGACWDVITNDDKYVFIANPFTFNVNSLAIGRNGVLTPVPSSTVVTEGLTFDEALSSDSKFLYVLVDDPNVFAYSEIYEYAVGKDGRLTALGKTARFEGSSAGMAAT